MTPRAGTVAQFDAHSGLGEILDISGVTWAFHCVSIADGSRNIEPDTPVWFTVAPLRPGIWEAADIHPRPV